MSKRPDEKKQPYRFWVLENLYSADYIPKGLWLSKVNALRFADEADKDRATIAALRAQLADAEAACAGYRAALDGLTGMFAPHGICEPVEGFAGRPQDLEGCIRQALQSNPGKAVGDVIAAARTVPIEFVNGDVTPAIAPLQRALANLEEGGM